MIAIYRSYVVNTYTQIRNFEIFTFLTLFRNMFFVRKSASVTGGISFLEHHGRCLSRYFRPITWRHVLKTALHTRIETDQNKQR